MIKRINQNTFVGLFNKQKKKKGIDIESVIKKDKMKRACLVKTTKEMSKVRVPSVS